MVTTLKKVLVRTPNHTFGNADPTIWHYTSKPNFEIAVQEHNQIVKILQKEGVEVIHHNISLPFHADATFIHDAAIVTDYGAIIFQMGKKLRKGEDAAIKEKLQSLNIPILYELHDTATAEGGDMLWINEHTLAIGRSYRTNQEGIN